MSAYPQTQAYGACLRCFEGGVASTCWGGIDWWCVFWVYRLPPFLMVSIIWGLTEYAGQDFISWERQGADQSGCPECCCPNNLPLNNQGPLSLLPPYTSEFRVPWDSFSLQNCLSFWQFSSDLLFFRSNLVYLYSSKFLHHFWNTSIPFLFSWAIIDFLNRFISFCRIVYCHLHYSKCNCTFK